VPRLVVLCAPKEEYRAALEQQMDDRNRGRPRGPGDAEGAGAPALPGMVGGPDPTKPPNLSKVECIVPVLPSLGWMIDHLSPVLCDAWTLSPGGRQDDYRAELERQMDEKRERARVEKERDRAEAASLTGVPIGTTPRYESPTRR
jgi:hypothetical protein